MINNFLIGIGGTGAKCVEAFVHSCAAGLMSDYDNKDTYLLFVDPDVSNGNLQRAQETIRCYQRVHDIRFGRCPLTNADLKTAAVDNWSPLSAVGGTLSDIFKYNSLRLNKDKRLMADLFDILYSEEERETELTQGFRGHPSIGAAVLANTLKLGEEEPWKTFKSDIIHAISSGIARIFLIGSIFGGTGASGFPTIARLIRNEFEDDKHVKLGGALILPYFSFVSDDEKQMKANSEDFMINTDASLSYYHNQNYYGDIYNSIYIIGDRVLSRVGHYSIGSSSQINDPHFIELYASLAAIHFFGGAGDGFYLTARKNGKTIEWSDLPYGEDKIQLRSRLAALAKFSYAYLSVYYPALEEIRATGNKKRAPWYIDYFVRNQISIGDEQVYSEIVAIKDYCEEFITWISALHSSADQTEINLFDRARLQGYGNRDSLSDLVVGSARPDYDELGEVWNTICSRSRRSEPNLSGIGLFIKDLYQACS